MSDAPARPGSDGRPRAASGLTPFAARSASRTRAEGRGTVTEYLAFRLADDAFGAPVAMIREILKPPPMTNVPRAPRHVLGIVSVRGLVVTVFDLRRMMRLPEAPLTARARILLVAGNEETLGLMVDEVLEVHRLPEADIERASVVVGSDVSEAVSGIARPREDRDDVLVLLDLRVLLR